MAEVQLSTTLVSFAAEDPGGWGPMVARAEMFDRVGFDRLAVSDHVVFGEALDDYGRPEVGGTAGGRQPTGPDGHWLEPLTVLTYVAARTTRVRLATNIVLAALRRPVVLAKTVATLDVLSGGRVDLGVGVGWQKAEYDAAGLDFSTRGEVLDETLAACRALWTEQRASIVVDGQLVDGLHMMPKPLQPGGVPIWVSGTVNGRVARRLVANGGRWIPWGADALDPATGIARMKEAVAAAGGDPDALETVVSTRQHTRDDGSLDIDATLDAVPDLVAAGVTDVRIAGLGALDEDTLASLVAAFRAAVGRPAR